MLHIVLCDHPISTQAGNRGECTVHTEGNREVRGREGGREVIDDGGRKEEGVKEIKEGEMAGGSDGRSEWRRGRRRRGRKEGKSEGGKGRMEGGIVCSLLEA